MFRDFDTHLIIADGLSRQKAIIDFKNSDNAKM